ncbi:MAG: hypothetical protein SVU88_02995, partial [Candidatus Nanohaloarchaea archaeon]|nr:hypothetical protein [Candidatus Nanohaloarchaea archaeon]
GVERAGIVAFLLILITLPLYTGFILNSPMGGSDITWLAVVAILLLFLFGRPLMKGVRRLL